ncbi:alpha-galactosidase [Aquimarina addita]|uniref:Alpha-galactosidase n=2 Tax=Aquimarina addita TaxID=870485 RepID=A0ABP6UKQ7_9FLAO
MVILWGSCSSKQEDVQTSVLKIEHGNLLYEVNDQLQTSFSVSLPDTKPVMSGFQASEKIEINHKIIEVFNFKGVEEESLTGVLSGKKWSIKGSYTDNDISIDKELILIAYDAYPDLITTKVIYTNAKEDEVYVEKWINNEYNIHSQGDTPLFWAFQGSSTQKRSDWIKPLEPGFYQKNFMGMNDTDYGGGIPVTSVWRTDINVAVGHLALVPKIVSLPTEILSKGTDVKVAVAKDFKERTVFKGRENIETLETFLSVTKGDYFANLERYSNLMQAKGIKMVPPEDAAFESIWCAWGYERKFTLDEIIKTLPKVKDLGIKWAVLDDGFQIAEGDWDAHPEKFPKGNIEIKNLVDKIHDQGLKAKIWWTPLAADPHSDALQKNPEMRIRQRDDAPQFITWWDAYYLSPSNPKTIEHTKEIIELFMGEWGFDGLKMDGQHMNAVGADYGLEDPDKAPEAVPAFFDMIYEEARKIKPHAVVEHCPCGACMSYFNMASTNQVVSSDPLSSWQIRHKGKTYKALIPKTAYYGDHVELSDNKSDFASSFGVGAVLGTKFTWPKDNQYASESFLLTPEKEKIWKKWFSLYDDKMLSKEPYLGSLYDIGYDKPETHVIKKEDVLYFSFYAKKWNNSIELRGLDANTEYIVKDYFNEIDLGKVTSKDTTATINAVFEDFLLLEVTPVKK